MNEEEAIEYVQEIINDFKNELKEDDYFEYIATPNNLNAIETVLNLLEKKDKVIDEMAKCIDIELSSSRLGIILNKNVKPLESYKKDIKQYFERKVENG